jgi:hypothetical protein
MRLGRLIDRLRDWLVAPSGFPFHLRRDDCGNRETRDFQCQHYAASKKAVLDLGDVANCQEKGHQVQGNKNIEIQVFHGLEHPFERIDLNYRTMAVTTSPCTSVSLMSRPLNR